MTLLPLVSLLVKGFIMKSWGRIMQSMKSVFWYYCSINMYIHWLGSLSYWRNFLLRFLLSVLRSCLGFISIIGKFIITGFILIMTLFPYYLGLHGAYSFLIYVADINFQIWLWKFPCSCGFFRGLKFLANSRSIRYEFQGLGSVNF